MSETIASTSLVYHFLHHSFGAPRFIGSASELRWSKPLRLDTNEPSGDTSLASGS